MKILLVEDNPLTAKGLQYLLEREGYEVDTAEDMAAARLALEAGKYDLAVLDVNLPDASGFDLARQMKRQTATAPIIFLTARDDENDVVQGLKLGAEDYITKPFRNRELLLRIEKAMRQPNHEQAREQVGPLELVTATGEFLLDGVSLELSALERRLLTCLMRQIGQTVTREQLLNEIWSASGKVVNDNTLSVYLRRLRQKLQPHNLIQTVKQIGYRLREP